MFGLGPREIVILAVVLVLLFGSKKIPELASGIGEARKQLRKSFSDEDEDDGDEKKDKTDKQDHTSSGV